MVRDWITKMKIRTLTLCLIASSCCPLQVRAWKTRLANRSVHGWHTYWALDILQAKAHSEEWRRYRELLEDSSGSLLNDSNSHGNLILQFWERLGNEGPSDPNSPEGKLVAAPLTFNGGPFYRYFIRLQEANAQINGGIPDDPGPSGRNNARSGWKRNAVNRPARTVYRYMGYLTHLVQDNCSPAHAANIRHGIFEGIEFWHWHGTQLGGRGADVPQRSVQDLLGVLNARSAVGGSSYSWWDQTAFQSYWSLDSNESKYLRDRGRLDNSLGFHKPIEDFLTKVVDDTRRWMPRPENVKTTLEARALGEVDSQKVWKFEDSRLHYFDSSWTDSVKDYINGLKGDSNNPQSWTEGAALIRKIQSNPQFQPTSLDSSSGYLATVNMTSPVSWDPNDIWKTLNQGKALWLPNPEYHGQAFEFRNWGSYGGYFGFPGRYSVEGDAAASTFIDDFFTTNKARIIPGDLYLKHPDQGYAVDRGGTGYFNDERSLDSISANFEWIGNEQVERSVLWSAVLLENLSKSLPPVITGVTVSPRRRGESPHWWDILNVLRDDPKGLPIKGTSQLGANIRVKFGANRNQEAYKVEFYAIPKLAIFKELSGERAGQLSCTRKITLNDPENKVLYASDIEITDNDGNVGRDEGHLATPIEITEFKRNYDYVYSSLPLFPLKGVQGAFTFSQSNLSANSGESTQQSPMLIPTSSISIEPLNSFDAPPYVGNVEFTWTGEVGQPVFLSGDKYLNDSDKVFEKSIFDRLQPFMSGGRTLLRSGEYFILIVLYREGMRNSFAHNQFKLMTEDRKFLESFDWWSKMPWSGEGARSFSGGLIKIPDELYPFIIDGDSVRLGVR